MFEGINQGLRNLREVPVEVDPKQNDFSARPANMEQRGVLHEIPIDRTQNHPVHQSAGRVQGQTSGQGHDMYGQGKSGRREIPIQIVAGSIPAQTQVHTDTKLESPRQSQQEKDKKKADLEKRRIDLERDINNVIFEAIKQVPGYKQSQPSQATSQQLNHSEPVRSEKPADDEEEEVFEQQQIADRKQAMQSFWEALERSDNTQKNQVAAYATLPVRKRTQSDERRHKVSFETEAGSYATLPSFGHKTHESPKPPRRVFHDRDFDHSFSDVEGGRGKAQPSWRPPDSPLQYRHVWKPIIPPKETNESAFIPPESPAVPRRAANVEAPPPRVQGHSLPVGGQGQVAQTGQGQSPLAGLGHSMPTSHVDQHNQQPKPPTRNVIPIPIQYEQKQKKGNSVLYWHVAAW